MYLLSIIDLYNCKILIHTIDGRVSLKLVVNKLKLVINRCGLIKKYDVVIKNE